MENYSAPHTSGVCAKKKQLIGMRVSIMKSLITRIIKIRNFVELVLLSLSLAGSNFVYAEKIESQALKQFFEIVSWEDMKCEYASFDINAHVLSKNIPNTSVDSMNELAKKVSLELLSLDKKISEPNKNILIQLISEAKNQDFYTKNIFAPKKISQSTNLSHDLWYQIQTYFQLIKAKNMLSSIVMKDGQICNLLKELDDDEKVFLQPYRKVHNCGSLEDFEKGVRDCAYQNEDWSVIFREYVEREPSFVLFNNKNRRMFYFDSKATKVESLKWNADDNNYEKRQSSAQTYCEGIKMFGASWKLPDLNDLLSMGYWFVNSFTYERKASYSELPMYVRPLISQPSGQRGFYLNDHGRSTIREVSQSVGGRIICISN